MEWFLVPAAYCLGSVSFSLLLVGWLQSRDLREIGSGNPGATNVLRSAGRLPALAVLVLDITKGVVPILVGERIEAPGAVLGATAVAVVVGHMYPIFHGFRGGKGVATTAGALGALQPQLLLVVGAVFLLTLTVTRFVSLASMLGVVLYPILAAASIGTGRLPADQIWLPVASGLIAALVVWRHRANIQRLLAHREARLGTDRRTS